MVAKIISYIVYLVIIVVAVFMQSKLMTLVAQITFIIIGALTMIYSYGIFNVSKMSYLHSEHPEFARIVDQSAS